MSNIATRKAATTAWGQRAALRVGASLLALAALTGCAATRSMANSDYMIKPAFVDDPTAPPPTYVLGCPLSDPAPAGGTPSIVIDRTSGVDCDTQVPPPINLAQYKFDDHDSATAKQLAIADTTGATRNRLKSVLLEQSDSICAYTEAHIEGNSNFLNFGLGESSTIVGATGALVTAVTPARVLSGVAGMFSATQGQVANNFYQNTVTAAIIQKMDTVRGTLRQAINQNDDKHIVEYSYEAMKADLTQYHDNCAFVAGIKNIPRDTDKLTPATGKQTVGGVTTVKPQSDTNTNTTKPKQQAQPAAKADPAAKPPVQPAKVNPPAPGGP
jgi:hypothetical protein